MGFVALPSEPDLLPLLRALANEGREVFLPRWNVTSQRYEPAKMPADGNLVAGPFGVFEPPLPTPAVSHEPLDLILVPGLAFDADGRRLGRGRGFYDRILAQSGPARRWGVAFDLQIVEVVPCEMHDVKLDRIATPAGWLSNSHRHPSPAPL
jgi:5-formyltetrahydrofolate cyclo-ligase